MVIIHFTWLASQSFAKGVAGRFGAAARNSRNCRGETQADYNYIVMQITDIVWGGWSECVGACWISPSTSPSGLFFPLFSLPLAWQETREQENHLWFDILKPEDNYHNIQFLLVFAHVGHEWVSIQNVQIQHNEPPPPPVIVFYCKAPPVYISLRLISTENVFSHLTPAWFGLPNNET